jgi:hypothetical protein
MIFPQKIFFTNVSKFEIIIVIEFINYSELVNKKIEMNEENLCQTFGASLLIK